MSEKVVKIKNRKYNQVTKKRNLLQIFAKVFLVLFGISLGAGIIYFISYRNNISIEKDVSEFEMPKITFFQNEERVNSISGQYTKPSKDYISDTELLVKNGRINFAIKTDIKSYSLKYIIGSNDFKYIYDEGKVESQKSNKKLKLKDEESLKFITLDIYETIKSCRLFLILKTEDKKIYFPMEIKIQENSKLESNIKFAKYFSESTFSRSKLNKYETFLESNRDQSENTYEHVTIKSTSDYIAWDGLNVKKITDSYMFINKIDGENAVFTIKYRVNVKVNKKIQRYLVVEKIEVVSKDDKTIYLMNYDRRLYREIMDDDKIISGKSLELGLGALHLKSSKYVTSKDGNIVTFVSNEVLWQYSRKTGVMRRIYPLLNEKKDVDLISNHRDIKIMDVDNYGNVKFLVAGNILYSDNAGKTGVGAYYYQGGDTGRLYEDLFIESGLSLNEMKNKLYKYITSFHDDGESFYLLDNTLYKYKKKTSKKVDNVFKAESFVSNKSGQFVGYSNFDKSITVYDLVRMTKIKVEKNDDEILKTIGFVGNNFVYGICDKQSKPIDENSKDLPISKIIIIDEMGRKIKEYQKESQFFKSVKIANDNIEMEIVSLSENGYEPFGTDYINTKTDFKKTKTKLYRYISTDYGICTDIKFNKLLKKIDYKKTNLMTQINR